MCGLVGFLQRYQPAPAAVSIDPIRELVATAPDQLTAAQLQAADDCSRLLVLWRGFSQIISTPELVAELDELRAKLDTQVSELKLSLESAGNATEVEKLSHSLTALLDISWRIKEDALNNVRLVKSQFDVTASSKLSFEFYRLQIILNNLARLEVRGRDSGGIAVVCFVNNDDYSSLKASWESAGLSDDLATRLEIEDFKHLAIQHQSVSDNLNCIAFAHKEAHEIGELGANIRALTASLASDKILRSLLAHENVEVQIIAHNRWASNGIINQANCHPLTQARRFHSDHHNSGFAVAALNGDIDNYPRLKQRLKTDYSQSIAPTITTDAKIIPVEIDRRLSAAEDRSIDGYRAVFAETVREFEGSFAIVANVGAHPDIVALAQRGSGQALFVGETADGGILYASELYGVVELCQSYVQLDGVGAASDSSEYGEIVYLQAGATPETTSFSGASRSDWESRRKIATITTRDINKAGHEHYLLKEVTEASRSVERTLQGRLSHASGSPELNLEDSALTPECIEVLKSQRFHTVYVIGQGTAAIAAQAIASMAQPLARDSAFTVRAMKATELSGFHIDAVSEKTLIVAVSQSGTTTDTNRTVDLAKERGAQVIAIVNRRESDLTVKAHGVLYTSDGRDIEMSVASTKAFYCQVVAGYLLFGKIAEILDLWKNQDYDTFLHELSDLPRRMNEVLSQKETIRGIARTYAGTRRYWAVVGSGSGRIAAEEIRIKLSELCYKSISSDTVEDKKHIDLSAEALVFVCAAGLSGSNANDAVKEVGIFKAHNSLPIVVCDRGETRFGQYASATIEVPASSAPIALLLNTVAGHLFGYYAALQLDLSSTRLKSIRELVESTLESLQVLEDPDPDAVLLANRELIRQAEPLVHAVLVRLHSGRFDSGLSASLAFRLGEALRMCLGQLTPEAIRNYFEDTARENQLKLVMSALSVAIDQLRRPIDAIKHQAKTVTVGISREATRLELAGQFAKVLNQAEIAPERLDEATVSTLLAFEPYVDEVLGCTHYAVSKLNPIGQPTSESRIRVVRKTGIAENMHSRVDNGGLLSGTKRKVASRRRIHFGRGSSDGRSLIILPLYDLGAIDGLALVHVAFRSDLATDERVRSVKLAGRYEDIRALVTERDSLAWKDELLNVISVDQLMGLPAASVAKKLRSHLKEQSQP